jgi:hypothetical protein
VKTRSSESASNCSGRRQVSVRDTDGLSINTKVSPDTFV